MDPSKIQGALNKAYPKAKLFHHANFATIMASVDDDANSVDNTMNKMDELMPQALILGGISHSDLANMRLGDFAYVHSPANHL